MQKKHLKKIYRKKYGNTYETLIESKTYDGKYYIGRTYMDIPEEDGVVFIRTKKNIPIGTFLKCKIVDVRDYDLIGEI